MRGRCQLETSTRRWSIVYAWAVWTSRNEGSKNWSIDHDLQKALDRNQNLRTGDRKKKKSSRTGTLFRAPLKIKNQRGEFHTRGCSLRGTDQRGVYDAARLPAHPRRWGGGLWIRVQQVAQVEPVPGQLRGRPGLAGVRNRASFGGRNHGRPGRRVPTTPTCRRTVPPAPLRSVGRPGMAARELSRGENGAGCRGTPAAGIDARARRGVGAVRGRRCGVSHARPSASPAEYAPAATRGKGAVVGNGSM